MSAETKELLGSIAAMISLGCLPFIMFIAHAAWR